MSAKERKIRRQRHPMTGQSTTPAGVEGMASARPGWPEWKWKTFPVFFMFSLGLFLGVYSGSLTTAWGQAQDNYSPQIAVFIVSALMMGFGFSRLTTRFLISRRWIKPRVRRP